MKKILYLMNVDWNWIKQRPQFIAEGLSSSFEVSILYRYKYNRKGLTADNQAHNYKLSRIYTIPFINKQKTLKRINDWIIKCWINLLIRLTKPDLVYVTNPEHIAGVPSSYAGKIAYDCMDYHSAFIEDNMERKQLIEFERELVNRADLIVVSSDKLKANLTQNYQLDGLSKRISVVRNGYNGEVLDNVLESETDKKEKFSLAYIGTISHWFDFDALRYSLEQLPNIEYWIIGPQSKVSVLEHPRIKYFGSVEHTKLYNFIKDANSLIMPFQLNDIVEAVDPVKLYEYINFNKNIISIRYDEVERFEDFVYFYNTKDEFVEAIRNIQLSDGIKYSFDKRITFLKHNTWKSRVKQLVDLIKKL